ncbi:MAG: HlyD family secretion protein [Calditrichaceae bacterium]
MSGKNHRILIIIGIVLAAMGIFFLPIKVPHTIDSIAKILPAQQWILSRGNDGQILTSTINFSSGINNSYQLTSFERGESIVLTLNPELSNGQIVAKGDTLAIIYSSRKHENLIQLDGELQILKASLRSGMSGNKITEVREAEERLAMAQSESDKQEKITARLKELFDKDLIAGEEYQIAADELNTLVKAVNVRQAELESSMSGEKVEEIHKLTEQINAVENEIFFLKQQMDSQNLIISPFSGRVERSFTNDTLLILSNFDSAVACIPVPLKDAAFVREGGNVFFDSPDLKSQLSGEVQMTQPVMQLIGGKQCIIVLATVNSISNDFISGMLTPAKIKCSPLSIPFYLKQIILN